MDRVGTSSRNDSIVHLFYRRMTPPLRSSLAAFHKHTHTHTHTHIFKRLWATIDYRHKHLSAADQFKLATSFGFLKYLNLRIMCSHCFTNIATQGQNITGWETSQHHRLAGKWSRETTVE